MSEMTASIVIITLNRSEALSLLIEQLTWQKYQEFEVVVVVGPTEDDTMAVLAPFEPFLKIVRCPVANISMARNIGVEASAGDVIVFIDDDAYPADSDWLQRYMDVFSDVEHHSKTGVVGGEVMIRNEAYYEFKKGLFNRDGFQVFELEDSDQTTSDQWMPRVAGGNNACLKRVFVEVGGYDENISYYMDETDFCCRIHDKGYAIHPISNPIRHYRYPSKIRNAGTIVDRFPIARSDFYFCLSNSIRLKVLTYLKLWWMLPTKHYFKEVFKRGENFDLTLWQRVCSLWSVYCGAVSGCFLALRHRNIRATFKQSSPFLKFDVEKVRSLALEHFCFRNNPMGEGSSSFSELVAPRVLFQLYWAGLDQPFAEIRSVHASFPSGRMSEIRFQLSPTDGSCMDKFRVDPLDRPGRIEFYSLEIVTLDGERVARWKGGDLSVTVNRNDLFPETATRKGCAFLAKSNDPWFMLDIPRVITSPVVVSVKLWVFV